MQRWRTTIRGVDAQVDAKTTKNRHTELMGTGSVAGTRRNSRPSKSRDQTVQEMFPRSSRGSIRQQQVKVKSPFTQYEQEGA